MPLFSRRRRETPVPPDPPPDWLENWHLSAVLDGPADLHVVIISGGPDGVVLGWAPCRLRYAFHYGQPILTADTYVRARRAGVATHWAIAGTKGPLAAPWWGPCPLDYSADVKEGNTVTIDLKLHLDAVGTSA